MDLGRILIDLLVILVVSRLAAEGAERLKQPAVLAEILLGIVVGPSLLGIVSEAETLRVLGEIGVILLLFEVGRQMDFSELVRVGGASLRVATIGIVAPMTLGFLAMRGAGVEAAAALFLAAGITATSVGITARVFGDLRMLASVEARTVLGAAVADDVMGLLVLTIVVQTAGGGSLSASELMRILGVALGFVVVATAIGSWLAPKLLDGVARRARTDGTVMAIGLAVALAFARLAGAAHLAPIVGAFVAGLAVGKSRAAEDLHRRLTPLGHFFIPIFFLQIGIDTDVRAFSSPSVLGVAAILSACAVAGKLVSGLGVRKGRGDRVLIGAGMIPRGEVGLIFAGFGLSRGILDENTYAVLLIVVLATTLLAPPWVRKRIERARRTTFTRSPADVEPLEGWLTTKGDVVELAAVPARALAPRIAVEAAAACAHRRPGPRLLEWLGSWNDKPEWDESLRRAFFSLLRDGTDRSWRFLDVTGMLERLLPDVADAVRRRGRDPFELDPSGAVRWDILEELKRLSRFNASAKPAWNHIRRRDAVLLAALLQNALPHDNGASARRISETMGLSLADASFVAFLISQSALLRAASARSSAGSEEHVLDLASFLETPESASALYLLALGAGSMEMWERDRLDALYEVVIQTLEHPDLTGPSARDLVDRRVLETCALVTHMPESRIRHVLLAAPRRYLLANEAAAIAGHLALIETKLGRFEVRLEAKPTGPGSWSVHIAATDARGLLATIAGTFTASQVSVAAAQISTWRTGVALDVFKVHAPVGTDWERVRRTMEARLAHDASQGEVAPIEGTIEIDNAASPWYSIVEIRARDRTGLLYRVASSMARIGLQVHQAAISTRGDVAEDVFWVTGPRGAKLGDADERTLREALAGKTRRRRERIAAR